MTTKEFIQIDKFRIRKSTIKSYHPEGKLQINLYYSTSQRNKDVKIVVFQTPRSRTIALKQLDKIFIL